MLTVDRYIGRRVEASSGFPGAGVDPDYAVVDAFVREFCAEVMSAEFGSEGVFYSVKLYECHRPDRDSVYAVRETEHRGDLGTIRSAYALYASEPAARRAFYGAVRRAPPALLPSL